MLMSFRISPSPFGQIECATCKIPFCAKLHIPLDDVPSFAEIYSTIVTDLEFEGAPCHSQPDSRVYTKSIPSSFFQTVGE